MLDSIRNQKRLLFGVLLLLILPSFVFFGVQGYDRMLSDEGVVAVVGKRRIMQAEYDEAVRRQLAQMQQMMGGQVDPKLLDTPELRKQVLESLIAREALAADAAQHHLTVTDARLRAEILAIPGLQKEDGSFDTERYRSLLAAQNLDPARFEAQLRRDLAVQAPPDALNLSAIVPATVAERVAALGEQVRDVREWRFRPADQRAKVQPTAAQLKDYYERNGKRFETPESAKIEYVVLDPAALSAQVTPGADDVRTYYEQNKARYTTPEERRASHILVTLPEGAKEAERKAARDKAEALAARVKAAPGEFAAIAKAESQDPGSAAQGGDLGFFTRETMVKPFADAAFALKEGEISGVVQSDFGFHVIQLTGIKPPVQRPFEEVRAEIETQLRREQASRRYAEAAETFSNLVEDRSDSLKPVAEKLKLEIRTVENYGRQGSIGRPADGKAAPVDNPKLVAAVFTDEVLKNGRNTQAVEVAPGTLAAARVVEYRPSVRKPFEAVEQEVRAGLIDETARRLAVEAGQAALKAAQAGTLEGAGFGTARAVSRVAPAGLPGPAIDAVFRTPAGKLPAFTGVDLGDEGYVVYAIDAVREGAQDEAAKQRRAALAQQMTRLVAQQDVNDYVESVKRQAGVKRMLDPAAKADTAQQP